MQKRERQNALLAIIKTQNIGSQTELAARLVEHGFAVTQASVSRDLVELGVIKTNGHYELPQAIPGEIIFGKVELEPVGENLIVGRCTSGLASAVTVRIDSAKLPEIVGTIAGDDTIFIAVHNRDTQASAVDKISAMFR